jgi:hypothetical protein
LCEGVTDEAHLHIGKAIPFVDSQYQNITSPDLLEHFSERL